MSEGIFSRCRWPFSARLCLNGKQNEGKQNEDHLDTACCRTTESVGKSSGSNPRTGGTGLESPEQVIEGYQGAWIAQSKYRDGLLRVVFVEHDVERKVLTVHWTSKVGKYWEAKTG